MPRVVDGFKGLLTACKGGELFGYSALGLEFLWASLTQKGVFEYAEVPGLLADCSLRWYKGEAAERLEEYKLDTPAGIASGLRYLRFTGMVKAEEPPRELSFSIEAVRERAKGLREE